MNSSIARVSPVSATVSRTARRASLLGAGLAALVAVSALASGCAVDSENAEQASQDELVDGVDSMRTGDGIVGLATPKGNGVFSNACTGSLIADRVVLTAAHCVIDPATGNAKDIFVYDGTSFQSAVWSVTAKASAVTAFPGYDVKAAPDTKSLDAWQNDVAVVVLPEAAPQSIRRLALAAEGETAGYRIGAQVRMTGYGSSGPTAKDAYTKRTGNAPIAEVRARIVALGKPSGSASGCGGDSGGPIQARDASGRVLGVASFISSAETCRGTTYYMRVSAFRPFIDGIVQANAAPVVPTKRGGSGGANTEIT